MPLGTAKERDALDRWFDSRRKLWWKHWRWAVGLAWGLTLICLLSGAVIQFFSRDMLVYGWPGLPANPLPSFAEPALYVWTLRLFVFPVAMVVCWVAAGQVVRNLALPAEVAITTAPGEIHLRSLARARLEFYRVLGWPVLTPAILILALYDYGLASTIDHEELARFAIYCTTFIGVLLFVMEWQIALLIRFGPRLSRNWIYMLPLVPVLLTLIFDPIYDYSWEGSVTNENGYLTSFLVAAALLGGIALAGRVWRYVMTAARIDGHVILAGMMTLMTSFRAPLETASGATQAVAFCFAALIHGVCIGNPIRGWTAGGIVTQAADTANGGVTYLGRYSPYWDPLRFAEPSSVGMFVLPDVFLPAVWVVLWSLAYYAFSIWVIRHAAAAIPHDYTGTWQQ